MLNYFKYYTANSNTLTIFSLLLCFQLTKNAGKSLLCLIIWQAKVWPRPGGSTFRTIADVIFHQNRVSNRESFFFFGVCKEYTTSCTASWHTNSAALILVNICLGKGGKNIKYIKDLPSATVLNALPVLPHYKWYPKTYLKAIYISPSPLLSTMAQPQSCLRR